MKAILQKVPVSTDASFAVQQFRSAYFDTPWHFHPELELVLVVQGTGNRFVGDHISSFKPGDLVLLGPNLPHWYRNDATYYEQSSALEAESIVVQFTHDFLGNAFFTLPETAAIRKLLNKAVMGVEIYGSTREKVTAMMHAMRATQDMERLLQLLSMLHTIAGAEEYNLLSNQGATGTNVRDSERINRIYEYVMQNFTEPIYLKEVSSIVNMCPSTFCRYFRKRTRKNFTFFLNEIRIGYACKMLIEEDLSITEICFMSGYNNVAFFNRQFKAIKKKTPLEFKQAYHRR